jgi:hypothetical protein
MFEQPMVLFFTRWINFFQFIPPISPKIQVFLDFLYVSSLSTCFKRVLNASLSCRKRFQSDFGQFCNQNMCHLLITAIFLRIFDKVRASGSEAF